MRPRDFRLEIPSPRDPHLDRIHDLVGHVLSTRPKGAPRFRLLDDPCRGLLIDCERCGVHPSPVTLPDWMGTTALWDVLLQLSRSHLHEPPPPPKPLTRRQRELELVRQRHRRGAWKL